MCGLAGRFHPVLLPPDPSWHRRADALLAHRGPDGSGHYLDRNCELVHRRLALIDLSATGRQPMTNEEGTVWVVFNGEIYNHPELRANLRARGHNFRGTSDTEVLVHLYEEFGTEMLERLRGMFAFAIYDQRSRQLLLARDRFGIKPLFHATHEGQFVFASEIKALIALPGFRPTLDRQACYDFLGLGFVPEPATGFREIHAVPRGTGHVVSVDGQRVFKFHQLEAQPNAGARLPEAADMVSERLIQAVKSQSAADVPVAALLSGGIDSSLVVAAHCRSMSEGPATFNVRFADRAFDETDVARAVSRHCGTRHETVEVDEAVLCPETIQRLLHHFDQPFADSSLIPTYAVCKAIRDRGVICTLSGDGGDEAFGGYNRFCQLNRLVQLMKLPRWIQDALSSAGNRLAGWTRDWGRQLAKAAALARIGKADSAGLIAGISNYLSEQQKQELVLPGAREQLQPIDRLFDGYKPRGVTELEPLSLRLTENLFAVGLPSDMLRKVDMMSMLASIEVRVPMLDEDVVAAGLTLPHRLKTDGGLGKLVLRNLAARWLPPQVASHPKHGFTIPLDAMATPAFHQMLEDVLFRPTARIRSFLNLSLAECWFRAFRQAQCGRIGGAVSREGLYQRVFMLLALELWLREHQLSW